MTNHFLVHVSTHLLSFNWLRTYHQIEDPKKAPVGKTGRKKKQTKTKHELQKTQWAHESEQKLLMSEKETVIQQIEKQMFDWQLKIYTS